MDKNDEALRMEGITKSFPGVLANDRISLNCRKGEVLGLQEKMAPERQH